MAEQRRLRAILTVDLEDYRSGMIQRHTGRASAPAADEVREGLDILLATTEQLAVRATFFAVGYVVRALPRDVMESLARHHELGAHGDMHRSVHALGARRFAEDLRANRESIEERAGVAVRAFRAPFFSANAPAPWFAEILAREGFTTDSSLRLSALPSGNKGTFPLAGSDGAVTEVPFAGLGYRSRGLAIIGGSWLRLLPAAAIVRLMRAAAARGFHPMVYLHPYDLHASAASLDFSVSAHPWRMRCADSLRRAGRASAAAKLEALAAEFEFGPMHDFVPQASSR